MFLKHTILSTKPFSSLTMDLNFLSGLPPTLAANKMEILLECEFHHRKIESLHLSCSYGTLISFPKTIVNVSITV